MLQKSLATASFIWLMAIASLSVQAADVCDYTPSNLVGVTAAKSTGVGAAGTAATGIGMKAVRLYANKNPVTGAWMLGSTAVGASAAGTSGILAGTAGAMGTVGAVLMSTPVIIAGTVVAIGVGAYEGGCYLAHRE